ncbi:MAG: hypothetical protein ABFC24_09045 [Methanoregulaceae archaeon]
MFVEACGVGPFRYIFFHNIACYLFIGSASEVHNSVEGYEPDIAAAISNRANITAHRGKTKYLPNEDCFSAILKCPHPKRELYFLSIARDRLTLSSCVDEGTGNGLRRGGKRVGLA